MKKHEVSKEQFAKWSFERDRSVGLFGEDEEWSTLDAEERKDYIKEAGHYMVKQDGQFRYNWPRIFWSGWRSR